jgi:zinc protease
MKFPLLLACTLLSAQPPASTAPHAFKLPPLYETKLPNGLTVVLVQDARLPLVTLRLAFACGNRRDPEDLPGVAAAVADTLPRATRSRASRQLGEAIAGMGGSIDASSGADFIAINGAIVSGHFADLLDVVADVARNAELSELDLLHYKQTRRQSLARQLQQPAFVASQTFRRELFGTHPYARVAPTQASLAALNRKALVDYRDTWLVPNNAFLIVVGSFPARADTMKLITDRFGTWERKALPQIKPAQLPKPAVKRILIDRPGATQADVRIGSLSPTQRDPDYFATLLAGAAAGTHDLHPDPVAFDEAGILSFTARVDNDALPTLFDHAAQTQSDAKSAVAEAFMHRLDTQAGLAEEIMVGRIQGLPANFLETWRPNLEAAKPTALAESSVVVVVGDASKLRTPLEKKLGKFEIVK